MNATEIGLLSAVFVMVVIASYALALAGEPQARWLWELLGAM